MTVASFFLKYNVGCILNYVRLIITGEISCIYIQLLLQLCTEVSQVTTLTQKIVCAYFLTLSNKKSNFEKISQLNRN
jgi:hypothetical protein